MCYITVAYCHFAFVQANQEMYASEFIRIKNLMKVRDKVKPRIGHEGPEGGRGIAPLFL